MVMFTASPFADIWVVRSPATVAKSGGFAPSLIFNRKALPFSALIYNLLGSSIANYLEFDMISVALASLLLSAAPNAAQSRADYAGCLKDFIRSSLEQKMEAAAFDTALAGACQDKQALFKTTMVNADVAMGMKRAASEKAIAEQIADYVAMAKEDYRADLTTAAKTP